MEDPTRPRRFIVVPKDGLADESSTPSHTVRTMRLHAAASTRGASAPVDARPPGPAEPQARALAELDLKVINRSPADGAVLLEAPHASITQVQARAPAGAKVFEEKWYHLERFPNPWLRQLTRQLKRPHTQGERTRTWTVTVHLGDPARTRLKDVQVTAMVDEAGAIGAEATTDRYGRAVFKLGTRTTRLEAVYLTPLHGAWPLMLTDVPVAADAGLAVDVPALDIRAADARGQVYGKAPARAGRGVTVAVVDTGVGRHAALKVAGGRNTTTESPLKLSDPDGHGTHVAGVIASTAAGWRRGEAPAVTLRAYRIFEEGEDAASTFAISAAIKQAALDGCDLINLSIGGSEADGAVRDAIDQAWAMGAVCVAATGNDGRAQVDYPARYARVLAVSALGLEASWPAGAAMDWTLSRWTGKSLGGRTSFFASFSNRGAKVSTTAPGVAIVSTIPGDRWGVMSGTSMATPVATGVLARRLAASPVFGLPRDGARSAAIVALVEEHSEDLGFDARRQGHGLTR